jgi:hypothetical protein
LNKKGVLQVFDLTIDSERKIGRGTARLTEHMPEWKEKLVPDLIEMKSGYPSQKGMACVLGQLFGSYELGLRALGIHRSKAHEYGFDAPPVLHWRTFVYGGSKVVFPVLDIGWKRAVLSH